MPDIGDFIRQSRCSAKIAIAAAGTPGDFRRSRRSAYKIARQVEFASFSIARRLAADFSVHFGEIHNIRIVQWPENIKLQVRNYNRNSYWLLGRQSSLILDDDGDDDDR